MSYRPSFVSGDWKATCMICGRVFKGSKLRRRWDGFYVCPDDWEPKHPQLSVKGVRDDQRAPFVLPDPMASVEVWEQNPKTSIQAYTKELLVGTISQRPALADIAVGTRYFATDLGAVIIASDDDWRFYSNGEVVSGEDLPIPKGIGYWAISTSLTVG